MEERNTNAQSRGSPLIPHPSWSLSHFVNIRFALIVFSVESVTLAKGERYDVTAAEAYTVMCEEHSNDNASLQSLEVAWKKYGSI